MIIYFNSRGVAPANPSYTWLSNFYLCKVFSTYGEECSNVEAAFQSSKFSDEGVRQKICMLNGAQAKAAGRQRHPSFNKDWDKVCVDVMYALLKQKYSDLNPLLKDMLLATSDVQLIEYAPWGDKYWGVDASLKGMNICGRCIMRVRSELKL